MSKRHILISPQASSTAKQARPGPSTNWDLCVLCQVVKDEPLQCPLRSTKQPVGSGYASLAEDLHLFQTLQHMPMELNMERLDDGSGVEATLMAHHAQWHKKCRLVFNKKMYNQQSHTESSTEEQTTLTVHTRSAYKHTETTAICFFCNEPEGHKGSLHEAATNNIDNNVRKCATQLQDTGILAKLAAGDMVATEAKYHNNCLRAYYNRAREPTSKDNDENDRQHGIAFAELVAFIEDMQSDEENAPVFKLVDLAQMYRHRLEQLGVTVENRIHTSRLKLRLLAELPDLRAHKQGRDTLLTFVKDIGPALHKACDHDSDAMHLVRAAQLVRQEMFDKSFSFDGSFQADCQRDAVPPTLLALVGMILDGANIKHQTETVHSATTASALTISQLLLFNSVKHARSTSMHSSSSVRHSRSRETPLPLYVSLKIHAVTRSRGLVDIFHNLGLCVSYDRLLQISSDIANGVCQQFKVEDVVCPPKMRHGLFTTGAVDNIDHNPSSATAKDSFHGTGISLMQHPSDVHAGVSRGVPVLTKTSSSSKSVVPLPPSYTDVPPAALKTKKFTAPAVPGPVMPTNMMTTAAAKADENNWLSTVKEAVEKDAVDIGAWVSWAAYHAGIQQTVVPPPAINALLPLFPDHAHSVAMIRHSMDVIKAAVEHLNPGQIPVFAVDQPLYALAKQIQWSWPDTHGENHFIIMFGGLHIEMGMLKLLGNWLEDSGWTNSLVQADVASSGTADSFTRASHVTKTRHAHQVTAATLHILLHRAYSEYSAQIGEDTTQPDEGTVQPDAHDFEGWCVQRAKACVHFDYWLKTLSLELLLLQYVRSLREGNFQLYVESLTAIMPWMFALDHTHYSRWLSVHIRDMMTLADKHPGVLTEFKSGKFVVHKTSKNFSAVAIDQCHEQNNALVKGSGGAIGLTGNPGALRRWMVAGPEIARITAEFEEQVAQPVGSPDGHDQHHHEQHPGVQAAFLKDVKALISVFEDVGNPFLEESQDLLVIDTKEIMDKSIEETVRKVKVIGVEQYKKFVQERLVQCGKPVTDTLTRNKLPLFSRPISKTPSKQKEQVTALRSDCGLFSRLYISCQTRDGDLDQFFSHENQAAPPALSTGGKLRIGIKSDLLHCLESDLPENRYPPVVDATIIDGAVMVQILSPGTSKTFQDYADTVFVQYLLSQLKKTERIDLVWDVYLPDSLKGTARQKRGKGIRKRVSPSTMMPRNWKDFLRVDENKTELFSFLSREAARLPLEDGKELYATHGSDVLCSPDASDLAHLAPCSHEEADTRLLLHAADAVLKGSKRLAIRTVDTDVVVLAAACFNKMSPEELWVILGTGASFRYIPVHTLVTALNLNPTTLPIFHAMTGCDTVSAFAGRGKKKAWETWKSFPEVNEAFLELTDMPAEVSEGSMALLERFVVLIYDRTSDCMTVNEARKQLFSQKSRSLENIPPTLAALQQHIKRASYQANCWNQALILEPNLPDPSEWGWKKETSGWQPLWTTLPEASRSCHELIHCGCKKGCTGRCTCKKAALKCTALCTCAGDC